MNHLRHFIAAVPGVRLSSPPGLRPGELAFDIRQVLQLAGRQFERLRSSISCCRSVASSASFDCWFGVAERSSISWKPPATRIAPELIERAYLRRLRAEAIQTGDQFPALVSVPGISQQNAA